MLFTAERKFCLPLCGPMRKSDINFPSNELRNLGLSREIVPDGEFSLISFVASVRNPFVLFAQRQKNEVYRSGKLALKKCPGVNLRRKPKQSEAGARLPFSEIKYLAKP